MREIVFDGNALELVEHNGKLWLRSADIARALGYSRTNKIGQIYWRHAAEFTPSMTTETRCLSLGHGNPPIETRLFSLRGAHLLGMFSRTAVGVKFRRWVLDQLEELEQQNPPSRSLIAEWYEAKAALNSQEKFASFCGKGLSQHKKLRRPLISRIEQLTEKIQIPLLT
jgi:prophage antirepressor-like protein